MKSILLSMLLFISVTGESLSQISNCPMPTGMNTTAIGQNSATFNWTAGTGNTYFQVRYRPAGVSNANWLQTYAQTNSVSVSGLQCNVQYEWQVQAMCATGGATGAGSGFTVSTLFTTNACQGSVCSAPTGLSTTSVTTTSAVVSWTPVTGAAGYQVQYRPVSGSLSQWQQTSAQTSTATLQNLVCNTAYEWQVRTFCNSTPSGISAFSTTVTFTTAPCTTTCPVPTGLASSNITSNSAHVSWTATAGNYFNIRYRPAGNPNTAWQMVYTQANPHALTNLLCNTQYEFQVRAICSNSTTGGGSSNYSASAYFTTSACPPACQPPTAPVVNSVTLNTASVSWTAAPAATAYVVRYRPIPASGLTGWMQVMVTTASATLSNLICNRSYEWQVQALCGPASNTGSLSQPLAGPVFTTLACPTHNCPVPGNLSASNVTMNSAALSWNNTGVPAYTVRYRQSNMTTWTSAHTTTNSITLSNLSPGRAYVWQVRSNCSNSAGTVLAGNWSQASYFSTPTQLVNPYPNPSSTFLVVPYTGVETEFLMVELLNSSGFTVTSVSHLATEGENLIRLNTADLPEGQYMLRVIGRSDVETRTIFIRR